MEMATSADVIGSQFFDAFGYNGPESYIVNFGRGDLILSQVWPFIIPGDLLGPFRYAGNSRPMKFENWYKPGNAPAWNWAISLVETLISGQVKIGGAVFRKVLSLDNFLIRGRR